MTDDGKKDGKKEDGKGDGNDEVERELFFCDLCGHEMLDRHCKLLCLQCGYQRDCSDP